MSQPRGRRLLLGGVVTCLTLLGSLLVSPGPAQAYGSLNVRHARVDVDPDRNCRIVSSSGAGFDFRPTGNGCRDYDVVDYTHFVYDPSAIGLKVELRDSNGMVAKVEFHPYGEVFWIYDTRDDGDTIYITVCRIIDPDNPACVAPEGPWGPPGTNAEVDIRKENRDYPEGQTVVVSIWDNAAATDFIAGFSARS